MATIKDVAKEAGVSHSTVSRVFSNNSKISSKTVQRVLEAARKVGYVHKKNIEIPRTTFTNTIGLVTPTYFSHAFFFNVYEAIFTEADKMGYSLVLCRMNPFHVDQSNVDFIYVFDGKVDGIIFIGDLPVTEKDLQPLISKKYPMVSLFNKIDSPYVTNLVSDHHRGSYEVTSYLIKLGHTKIAHLMADGFRPHSISKLEGYKKALEDNNIEFDPRLVKIVNYSFDETYECSAELLDEFDDLTAVFCSEDLMAAAFINAAKDKGLKIPHDISVVGFDDLLPDNIIVHDMPLITTVRQARQNMATQAVYALINQIHGREEPYNLTFNLDLIIRNSTAPRRR
jgi:DNA-binding LacI/PurR family transcriptional regulator